MNERVFLKILTIFMTCGLIGVIVFPAAHIARGSWILAGTLAIGILLNWGYSALRRRHSLSILAERGPIRQFVWFLISVPSLILVLAIVVDAFNRSLPPYHDAIRIMQQSGVVKARIGEPVRIGWPVEGNSAVSNDSGKTSLRIPIAGGNGRGALIVNGTKTDGAWKVDELELVMRGTNTSESLLTGSPGAEISR